MVLNLDVAKSVVGVTILGNALRSNAISVIGTSLTKSINGEFVLIDLNLPCVAKKNFV